MIATSINPALVKFKYPSKSPTQPRNFCHHNAHFVISAQNNPLLGIGEGGEEEGRKPISTREENGENEDDPQSRNGRKPFTKSNNGKRKSIRGTSRRSILKSLAREQIVFDGIIEEDPVVAIIGGGISGLICAKTLEKRGFRSTVFDSGMHGLGGRMGTRMLDSEKLVFDHAAQFFTVTDNRFRELVDDWVRKGVVREWNGLVGELEVGSSFTPLPSTTARYIGVHGMRPLADSIFSESNMINLMRPCWISNIEPSNGMWRLSENGKPRGQFNAIVIAHNGKCANRLLSTTGLPLLAKQMKTLELSSIWALLAAFDSPLPLHNCSAAFPFEGSFVSGVGALSWMANNTKKLFPSQYHGPHCWTFFSSAAYAKQNKVPQESIPRVRADKVKREMLEAVETSLGLPTGSLPQPLYTFLQLWGAALPLNSPGVSCIFDPLGRAGICGDWLLGSSLEAAVLSGMAMGDHIADFFANSATEPDEFAIGLHNEFHPIGGHDIGQFAGLQIEKEAVCSTTSDHLQILSSSGV